MSPLCVMSAELQHEQTQTKPSKSTAEAVAAALKAMSSSKADQHVKHALLSLVSQEQNPPPKSSALMGSKAMKDLLASMEK